jgi:uncharacterized protein YuzE
VTAPIVVEVRGGAAYVRYADSPVLNTLDIDEDGSVSADVDAHGNIIGIEVLDVIDADERAAAADFARRRGLSFPRDLSGALAPA